MTLQQFAELRKLSVTKLKKICKNILGSTPENLTDEQIQALDAHLSASAQALLPQSEIPEEIATTIETIPEKSIDQVIEVVGVSILKKNASLYRNLLQETLSRTLLESGNVLNRTRAVQAQMIANTYEQMSRDLIAVHQEFSTPLYTSDNADFLTDEQREWLKLELKMM